ncbi:Flagellar biosynthesis protein FlhB [Olavius algarvensis spirochete endosymbiont]|uniref:flagellar biosynthesis protein FlhB n=1 Tax=Olavius algarvensis spirochete endosymbiont TaxID=260710 RepID=UPI000F2A4ED7|nr:flagellar biosynthesis protein FlhB [Olavius algarvensis spirochete endosymbiont]VDA99357.1 Flagellar biosynthesis protein FlhB [Olavius algarvensis spirochete endosymbiont]
MKKSMGSPDNLKKTVWILENRFDLHLQWFAAEDEGRTEDPTERKIRKAREEGKVVKSGDITSSLVILCGLLALFVFSGSIIRIIADMMRYFITIAISETNNVFVGFGTAGNYLFRLISPVMMVCFLAAFLGNVVQVGFVFSIKPITPDFSKIALNLSRWIQKAFLSTEALFNFFKSVTKIAIIVLLAYISIKNEIPRLVNATKIPTLEAMLLVSGIAIRMMLGAAILMLVFAIPDYFFQRKQHRDSLKMSKHEIKEEFKETEGDPLLKSRLRQRMQEMLSLSMARQVPEADVVITNPTHFAVALKWDSQTMHAPTVVAKGQDNLAMRIREIAEDNDIPLVENKPLAKALYDNVELGSEISEEYWEVVSIVLAEVYRLGGKTAIGASASG